MITVPTRWRWLDLGDLPPRELHATYTALARTMGPGDAPLLVWARPDRPHISVGATQGADADLDMAHCARAGIPVIQRPLGGGTVWLDPDQECFLLIVPSARVPGGHRGLFDLCLERVIVWFALMGLEVRRVGGQDLWCGERKILGSGAATQGRALIFGASVLRRFPVARFAECIRAPGQGFRSWLEDALVEGMTDWRAQGLDPDVAELQRGLRDTCARLDGWSFEPWEPDEGVHEAIAEAHADLDESMDMMPGQRHIKNGIRINALKYLFEVNNGKCWLRLMLDDGIIRRVESEDPRASKALQACVGEPAHAARVRDRLVDALPHDQAADYARVVQGLYESIPV